MRQLTVLVGLLAVVASCNMEEEDVALGEQTQASFSFPGTYSWIPSDGNYYLTSFGYSANDDGIMYCGQDTNTGSWFYAADAQRYDCGTRIAITNPATGRCAVAQTADVGPASWVEDMVSMPVLDASPQVSSYLFGTWNAGNVDHLLVHVVEVPSSTPLGAGNCPTGGGSSCWSATMAMTVPETTCVQSASDAQWYTCLDGAWVSGTSQCTNGYHWCATEFDTSVKPRYCQQGSDGIWRQCTGYSMQPPVSNWAGPAGACSN